MRTVCRYPLTSGLYSHVDMPLDARIVHVGHQEGNLTLWAEVDPDLEMRTYAFEVVPTGGPCPEGSVYAGTAVVGGFVWHVYEVH